MADKGLEDVPEGEFLSECCSAAVATCAPPQCESDGHDSLSCEICCEPRLTHAQARSSPTTMRSPTPSTT
ncbi:hypothetical protein IG631_14896 [Alternaria alternata]|nr:hypothetical protein IG631_14896 [Alternaria alternata]